MIDLQFAAGILLKSKIVSRLFRFNISVLRKRQILQLWTVPWGLVVAVCANEKLVTKLLL
jgi:hypothetical protein